MSGVAFRLVPLIGGLLVSYCDYNADDRNESIVIYLAAEPNQFLAAAYALTEPNSPTGKGR